MSEWTEQLRVAAKEIRAEGHNGWGNTCEWSADEIDRLTAENERLRESLADLFAMMDERLLVRNIENDDDPLWSLHALNFTRRLAKAHELIDGESK